MKLYKYDWIMLFIGMAYVIMLWGGTFNLQMVSTHQGQMPTYDGFFSDRFYINGWIYSIGDFMIYIGFILFSTIASYYIYLKHRNII